MTDTDNIFLYQKIDGYNPPNYYKLITSKADVENFLRIGTTDYSCSGKYNIDGSLASVVIDTSKDYSGVTNIRKDYSIICIQANAINEFFIGNIVKREILTNTSVRFLINIDWYTSQFCTAYFYGNSAVTPKASIYMERRSSLGRFDYIDDRFTPKYRVIKNVRNVKWSSDTSSTFTRNLFVTSETKACLLLIYNDTATNTVHWIGETFRTYMDPVDPFQMWTVYYITRLNTTSVPTKQEFNSSQVLFYGYIPVDPDCLHHEWYDDVNEGMYCFNPVTVVGTNFSSSADPRGVEIIAIEFNCTSTDMDSFTLRDNDGTIIWDIPKGIGITRVLYDVYFNPNISTPSITFASIDNTSRYNEQLTFSITVKPLTYLMDAESVYYAEQRVYNQEMRSFTNLNQLVSGLRGSVTEGAMMGAFSRSNGLTKAGIGGGASAAATVFNYAYTELYANKRQTEIEDKQSKVQADTLLFSSNLSVLSLDNMGLWEIKYDEDTIQQINNFHSVYGYQSDYVGAGIALNNTDVFKGYIQADIILDGGLRKEIEDYISKMFSYGITFSSVS